MHLTLEVVDLLGAWWGECGKPDDDCLVLPGDTVTGYLNPQTVLRRELYPAMVQAGIPRKGLTGENGSFHSFRHTFAKRALESGRPITWLSRHLGHSSLAVTAEVYGHFEAAEARLQAEAMQGVFGILPAGCEDGARTGLAPGDVLSVVSRSPETRSEQPFSVGGSSAQLP